MKLVDMKSSPEERQEDSQPTMADAPIYPYGLQINLCDDDLDKLGVTTLPSVGDTMVIQAKVKVNSVSSYDSEKDTERRVGFQITDMGLGKSGRTEDDVASKMYGNK